MRPPRRLIEPAMAGVSMRTRGLRASAASRLSTTGAGEGAAPGGAGTVPGAGDAGPPASLGLGCPGAIGFLGGCVCAAVCASRCCFICGRP
jgi:hypothetical protein